MPLLSCVVAGMTAFGTLVDAASFLMLLHLPAG
jgi:hypothetical protein